MRQYKHIQVFLDLWTLNNITSYRLLKTYCRILSDIYHHQTTNNFEKLLEQRVTKNTAIITTPIFLVIYIYIGSIRLLEDDAFNFEYNLDRISCGEYTGLELSDNAKVEKTMAVDNDNKNKVEDY